MLRWPGNVLRGVFDFLVILFFALVYAFGRLGTLFVRKARRRAAVSRLRGRVLRWAMTALGATFIKMGQVMSSRPDLLEPETIDELRVLQDRLPPFGFWRVRRTLKRDLGSSHEEIFSEIDANPVAAASVAQVHRARLKDGAEVAVKVLRPSIRRQVQRDAAFLLFGARVLALHPKARLSDPVGHVRHFVGAIIDQTDLRIERDNYDKFRERFASFEGVRFPALHSELCTEHVLVMEFIRGSKIDELDPSLHARIGELVRNTIFKMCFEDGLLHADLHPGNMLVTDSGELVIFDLGLAKHIEDDVLIQFIDLSKCLSMGTPDDVVAHMRRFHTYLGEVDWDALRADVGDLADRFRVQDIAELEYGELLNDMFAVGRKHNVRPITELMLVFVAMITAQGIGKMLEPDINVFAHMATFLVPILMQRGLSMPDTDESAAAMAGVGP